MFAYIGWTGHNNLGDDAIAVALREALAPAHMVDVPLYPRDIARSLGSSTRQNLRGAYPLLGGGTVIGRANWRLHVNTAFAFTATRPAFMIGAGVEDPRFVGKHSFSKHGEMAKWAKTLSPFDRVTVRGPQSAKLLGDIDIDCEVVGDPALLLNISEAPTTGQSFRPAVGFSLGYGDDLWGHDHDRVIRHAAASMCQLAQQGLTIKLLVVNPGDHQFAVKAQFLSGLDSQRCEIVNAFTVDTFVPAVQSCSLIVAERLHAGILAIAAGVPCVMLEYQPKCADFMASINRDDFCLRTDHVHSAMIASRITEIMANYDSHIHANNTARDVLRSRLFACIDRICDVANVAPRNKRAASVMPVTVAVPTPHALI